MRSILSNRTVIGVALVMIFFISTFTWVAVTRAGALCRDASRNSVIQASPYKGKMIWDEIAHGFIRTFYI
ncbi:MAG: hypothetical protein ACO1OO_15145 [Flavisolibacter sp.]